MESPGTPSSPSPRTPSSPPSRLLALCSKENIAAAVRSLDPAYADYANKVIEQGIDGPCIVDLLESPNADEFNLFLMQLGVSLVAHQKRLKRLFNDMHPKAAAAAAAVTDRFAAPAHDDAVERALWLKACLILEACAKGVKPFVGKVMQRLHSRVIENVKSDVMCDLGACEDAEWDCSTCHDADDPKFTENAPVALTIRAMDSNGLTDCGVAHELKAHALKPCRLKNIPAGCFPDCDGVSRALPLLLCPNPADVDNARSSTFLLLHCSQPAPTEPHLTPFVVTRCEPSEPILQFHAVLCCSCPGHTAQLVQSFLSQQPPPIIRANARGEFPELSFAFWSLQSHGQGFKEFRHGVKKGHILRFDGGEENTLPPGIKRGSRYLVSDYKDYSFTICGPILTPISPLTAESYPGDDAPLVVIRRSPIGRLRDAARLFHSRGMSEVHWSGIRVERLSSHHGEFCKLFCSQTSRQVDFFSDGGAQSGEQLFNMLGMCTAFSLGSQVLSIDIQNASTSKPFNCTVHSSPPVVLSVVASSSNPSDPSAPKPAKPQPIKLWTGCMSEAGVWARDECRLPADTVVSFSDAGCGLPLNMHAGCHYQPTSIGAGSFQLFRPNFCSLFDVGCSSLNDVKSALDKAKKGAAGQQLSKDLKDLLSTDPANHAALKVALEGVQEGPVDCEIAKYLRRITSVDREDHAAVKCALEDLKKALVGQQELREPGVIDFRNRLAHNMLTLEARHFEALVACARTMFAGVRSALPFVSHIADDCDFVQQSLAEIERIVARDSSFQSLESSLTDHERSIVAREHERVRQELDRLKEKLGRKFDSFLHCLKKDIQDQLVESNQMGESGGQGKVYRVKHWRWGQPLAVKVFHDTAERNAWLRELNSLTFLSHPNIVRMMYIVYETLDDRSQCRAPVGYAMELMAMSAADRRDCTFDQLLNVFVQIASALMFSHEHGVVHFDVKPENILLDESCSIAKLCDFGCAHKLKSAASSTAASFIKGQVRGTQLYMAPEVFRGQFEDAPKLCDIFSFGKTMWKLLHPSRDAELNRAPSVDADVPPALKQLIEQCTMDDAGQRPQHMSEVLERIQSAREEHGLPALVIGQSSKANAGGGAAAAAAQIMKSPAVCAHSQKALEAFCVTCKKSICSSCAFDRARCQTHEMRPLSWIVSLLRTETEAWVRVQEGRPQQLQAECERVDAAADAAVAAIRHEAYDLKLELQRACVDELEGWPQRPQQLQAECERVDAAADAAVAAIRSEANELKLCLQHACMDLEGHVRERMRLLADVELAAASPQGGVAGSEEARCLHAAATRAARPPPPNAGGGRFELAVRGRVLGRIVGAGAGVVAPPGDSAPPPNAVESRFEPAAAALAARGRLGRIVGGGDGGVAGALGRVCAVAAAGAGFLRAIGSSGVGDGQFNRPYGGVAFDPEGNLVVSDGCNHRVLVLRYSDGAHLRSIGSHGAGNGQFNTPWGVAFDFAGYIIVSDYSNHRVQVLRYSDGAHVRTFGSKGAGNGQFNYAAGIALDCEGSVVVFDYGNARVQVFRRSDGAYIRTIGSKGNGNGQFGAGNGGVAFDSEGNLVVADYGNHRVQVLRYRDGVHLRTIGGPGAGAGQFQNPTGVAFDAAGHLVVVEQGNHRVQVLRYADGAHVRTIGSNGAGNGQFSSPAGGIAIDSDGRIVVADTNNHRVQVLV